MLTTTSHLVSVVVNTISKHIQFYFVFMLFVFLFCFVLFCFELYILIDICSIL